MRSNFFEHWAATCRRFGLEAVVTALVALMLLAYANSVDNSERAAQLDAEANGMVVAAVIEGHSFKGRWGRRSARVVVQGVERITAVFEDQPLTRGTAVRVAWAPADPTRIYIVGARPWTWWATMRPLFRVIAGVALLVALTGLLSNLRFSWETQIS